MTEREGKTNLYSLDASQKKARMMVILYPFVILIVALVTNVFAFDISPISISLPSKLSLIAAIVSSLLLLINHSWLMTVTELTRVRYKMFATPEEWVESGRSIEQVAQQGHQELERTHNAHRNLTENSVYFVLLLILLLISSPSDTGAVWIWGLGYSVARLGHSFAYLSGQDSLRGLFMTLSLLGLYGMGSYLAFSLLAT